MVRFISNLCTLVGFCILHNNNKCYLHLFFHFFYICKKKLEKSKAWEEYYCKKVPKYFCASKTSLYAKVLRNWRQHNLFFTLVKIAVSNFRLVLFGDFLMDFTAFQFLMNIGVFKCSCKPTTTLFLGWFQERRNIMNSEEVPEATISLSNNSKRSVSRMLSN